MGLLLDRLKQIELEPDTTDKSEPQTNPQKPNRFPDLEVIPPELSLQILKYLNATDLCLAACVWSSLANDDVLWQSLCKSTWGYASIYNKKQTKGRVNMNYRLIFMHLDEATLTFNADWKKVNYKHFSVKTF